MATNESSQIVKAIKKALPAVVSISVSKNIHTFQPIPDSYGFGFMRSPRKRKVKMGGGSGFIIDPQGIILTNRHVVEDPQAEYIVVMQNGEKIAPKILAVDPINDIALLKIDPKKLKKKAKLPVIKFAESCKLYLGNPVVAIGNSLGIFNNTVSTGIVSGLSREIKAQSDFSHEKTKLRGLIQTDAAINTGNSGGPLINLDGQAIGINAAMVFGAENIGFALPIKNAKKDLIELKKYGRIRLPFLGLRYLPIDNMLKEEFNLPVGFGALVISEPTIKNGIMQAVVPNSPAHKAGIKEADIILEIQDKKVSAKTSINDILGKCKIGDTLPFKVLRKGKQKNLKVIIGEKK